MTEQYHEEPIDFKKMYLTLFNRITQALDALDQNNYGTAADLLKHAQIEAEELYLAQ